MHKVVGESYAVRDVSGTPFMMLLILSFYAFYSVPASVFFYCLSPN